MHVRICCHVGNYFVLLCILSSVLNQNLEAILNSALLSLEAASEAAFQAGQEELSMMGRDRCQYANTQLAMTQSVIKKAEQALASLQADSIRDTQTEKEDKK